MNQLEFASTGLKNEWHCLSLMKEHLKKGDVFVDVGSHIGLYVLYANTILGSSGYIHAIEPNQKSMYVMRGTLRSFDLFDKPDILKVHDVAISDFDGKRLFRSDYYSEASKLMAEGDRATGTHEREVEVRTLDSLIDHADFIKIDVEGEELNVLKGMSRLTKTHPNLLIELHHDQNVDMNKLLSLLHFYGYTVSDTRTDEPLRITGNIYRRTKHIFAKQLRT